MSRYARQQALPEIGEAGIARLRQLRVLVVGAGGLSAGVLPALAGAGVGRLRLLDPDRVELSNLHRQTLFRSDQIGQFKVQCAAVALQALNPEVEVQAWPQALQADTLTAALQEIDLVVDAADSVAVTYLLSDYCAAHDLPLVTAAVTGWRGYVAGVCGGGPSYRALFPNPPAGIVRCADSGVMGPVVMAIGAIQAQMALSWWLQQQPSPRGQLLQLDLATWQTSSFRFDAAPEPAPAQVFPFIAVSQLQPEDLVLELRAVEEAPQPVVARALRVLPEQLSEWQLPGSPARVVLCCRSGLRAWRAAQQLVQRQDMPPLYLLAVSG